MNNHIYVTDKNINTFQENLTFKDSIIFVGENVSGGIEVETNRIIRLIDSVVNEHNIIQFYSQGFPDYQIENQFNRIRNTNIRFVFVNETGQRYYKHLIDLVNAGVRVCLYLHSATQEILSSTLIRSQIVLSPSYTTISQLKQIGVKQDYVQFILDYLDKVDKSSIREIKCQIPKRFSQQHTGEVEIEILKQINELVPAYTIDYPIFNNKDQETVDNFYKNANGLVEHLPYVHEQSVKYYYNKFKFILHFPQQELIGITVLDQMQNGQIPIYRQVCDNGNEFGSPLNMKDLGFKFLDYLSDQQNIKRLKQFINMPPDQLDEYQAYMIGEIRKQYSPEPWYELINYLES